MLAKILQALDVLLPADILKNQGQKRIRVSNELNFAAQSLQIMKSRGCSHVYFDMIRSLFRNIAINAIMRWIVILGVVMIGNGLSIAPARDGHRVQRFDQIDGTTPSISASASVAERTITIQVDALEGVPHPAVVLAELTVNGVAAVADAVGDDGGPWTCHVASSVASQPVTWSLVAHNTMGSATASGSETIPADLFAPIAAGTLADLSLSEGVAMTPVDVAVDFTGTAPITFSMAPSQDDLPDGLSLSSAGVLSGTPARAVAVRTVSIRGSNAHGHADSAFTLDVDAHTEAPVLSATGRLDGRSLTVSVDTLSGTPTPTTALTRLILDGIDIRDAATGSGPWVCDVASSAQAHTVAWRVTATNEAGSDFVEGAVIVPADLSAPAWTAVPILSLAERRVTVTTGDAAGSPAPEHAIVAQLDGVPIAMSGPGPWTFAVPSSDGAATFAATVTATNSIGTVAHVVAVSIAPDLFAPTSAGALADLSLTEGRAIAPADLAADFSGTAPITYALAPSSAALPAGLSLSGAGVLSGTPTETVTHRSIVVRATNAYGFADSGFTLIVAAAPASGESLSTTATHDGVTFTFDKAMPVGTFADGSPYVVATEAFAVTQTSIPSEQSDGNWVNGMAFGSGLEDHPNGFDQRTGTIGGRTPYNDALNIDPGRRGEPVAIAAGTNDILVKAKSLFPIKTTPPVFHFIERYSVLTILAESPPAGSFRPPVLGVNRVPQFTEADLDYDVLKSLAMPASLRTASQCINRLPPVVMSWMFKPDQNRVLMTDGTFNGFEGNYSQQQAEDRIESIFRLHSDIPNAEKRDLLVRLVQMGLDYLGARDFGEQSEPDGGLAQGIIPPAYLAALVLGDSTLLGLAQSLLGNEFDQIFWVRQADIGRAVRYPSHTREWYHQTYQQVQLGIPEWGIRAAGPMADNGAKSAFPRSEYRFLNGPAAMAPLAIGLIDGGEAAWINGPSDDTNERFATLGYMDRLHRFMPPIDAQLRAQIHAVYDAHRDKLATPVWAGVPDLLNPPTLTAQDGAAGFALHPWTGEQGGTLIRHDISYTIDPMRRGPHPNTQGNPGSVDTPDPRQWIVVEDVGASGTIPNLTPGLLHHLRARTVTSEGVGPWSTIGPIRNTDLADQASVTPTGSPAAAAPVNTVAPKLFRKLGSHNGPSEYIEETGTIGESTTRLFVGVGYWTGAPAPTFTYQWQRDGVDIAGATGDFYDIQGADLGTDITCVVTATNSEAAVTATTAALEVPAEVVTTALWTPTGTVGEVPSIFDPDLGWWHASGDPRTIEFQDNPLPQVQFVPTTTGATAYSNMMPITFLGAIDDLSAVAEGEVVLQVRRQQAAAGGREGLVIRGHRDSATEGRGYLFGMFYRSDGIWALNVIRLDGTGHEILVSQATMTESVSAGSTTMARLRWTEDAGDLVLHGRYWLSGSAEPSEWALDGYRIESPYPPGMIGLGTHAARSAVMYRRIGLSLDPLNTPAPLEP